MEDRRKMVACLELCGKSDREITQLLDNADKRGDLGIDPFVPQRIQDYIDKAKVSCGEENIVAYRQDFGFRRVLVLTLSELQCLLVTTFKIISL